MRFERSMPNQFVFGASWGAWGINIFIGNRILRIHHDGGAQ